MVLSLPVRDGGGVRAQPISWMGFVDQAMQKLIFQWNPARGTIQIVNTFDVMEQLGLDHQLQARYQTPPSADDAADAGKSWGQVVARHQAELDQAPAIKAAYFADPDPIAHFGLPQAYADEGAVRFVRCQRAVFQQWKVNEPWASAGQVTIANGGDIAKALGVLPAGVGAPAAAAGLIVGPFNATLALSPGQEQAVRAAAAKLRPSLVEVAIQAGPNSYYGGAGMVLDSASPPPSRTRPRSVPGRSSPSRPATPPASTAWWRASPTSSATAGRRWSTSKARSSAK